MASVLQLAAAVRRTLTAGVCNIETNQTGNMTSIPSPTEPLLKMGRTGRIHDRFAWIATQKPAEIAISEGQDTWTYAQINTLSLQLAAQIQRRCNGRARPVAIYATRSAKLVISMLACSRAGLTFAVLDSAYPAERLRTLTGLVDPQLVLALDASEHDVDNALGLFGDPRLLFVNDALLADLRGRACEELSPEGNKAAYLLFTSGTTGHPKCISTSHAPLNHFVAFYANTFAPKAQDRFSMLGGLAHDPIMRDIFVPLSVGARICIPDQNTIANPIQLFEWIRKEQISFMHATPQLLRLLVAGAKGQSLQTMRYVFSGGDALRRSLVDEVKAICPAAKVVNFYGSTETPQAVAFHIVTDADEAIVPIGNGIADTQLLVLKDDHTLASPGEVGEIAVRTNFLSEGYVGDASLTSQRYIVSPFTHEPDDLIYLTGDCGMYRDDGAVLIRGRLDDQVKIRGYRVEPHEISQVLDGHPGLAGCAVLPQQLPNGENTLVAYLVEPRGEKASLDELKATISSALPAYMVPSRFVWIAALPLLPNGKLDRARLAQLDRENASPAAAASDVGKAENHHPITEAFRDILGLSVVDTSKSFDELGGDSLSFIQASMAVEKALGRLPEHWENTSIDDLLRLERTAKPRSYTINTSVLIRAVSITIIVYSHFTLFQVLGDWNTTAALFVLAGWSFATYQMNNVLNSGNVKSIAMTAAGIAVPTIIFTAIYQHHRGHIYWQSMLLIGNFYGPYFAYTFGYWFLEVLIQIYLIIAILFSIGPIRKLALRDTFTFVIAAMCVLFAISEILDQFNGLAYLENRLPTEKIILVFLGMALALANTTGRKLLVAAALIVQQLSGHLGLYPLLAILFVLMVSRVRLPVWLAYGINVVAASSLFIYLINFQFKGFLDKTPLVDDLPLELILTLVIGVVLWKLWSLVWPRVIRRLSTDSR